MTALDAGAAPLGGDITAGAGSITQTTAQTTIQQDTRQLSIDWQSFDVAADELVEFIQPGVDAVALNRVITNDASEIHGQIRANGQVVLINPNGVLFGSNAVVDVGALVASGLDIDSGSIDAELALAAREGAAGRVVNEGIITAATGGSVTLVGQQVINEGLIRARLGRVNLAGGSEAVLTFDERGLLGVRVAAATAEDALGGEAAVRNSGEILAAGGDIFLTAQASQDAFSRAVNHGDLGGALAVAIHDDGSFTLGEGAAVENSGRLGASNNVTDISAQDEAVDTAGRVVLAGSSVTHAGEIDASFYSYPFEPGGDQTRPGQVRLAASERVTLAEASRIDASGISTIEGGWAYTGDIKIDAPQILIEANSHLTAMGNDRGAVEIGDQLARTVRLASGATVSANSDIIGSGGGQIVIRASEAVDVNARLNTHGGFEAGGGDITVISGGTLGFGAPADTRGSATLEEPEMLLSPGVLTLRAPELLITEAPTATSISSAGLASMGDILLDASERVAVLDPVLRSSYGSLSVRARNQANRDASIDLANLALEQDDRSGLFTLKLEADGNIIMPAIGVERSPGLWPGVFNVDARSIYGSVLQPNPVQTSGGDYVVRARRNIEFVDGGVIQLGKWPTQMELTAFEDIQVVVDAEGAQEGWNRLAQLRGRDVNITNLAGPLRLDVRARNLTINAPGNVIAAADVEGLTQLNAQSGGIWLLGGDFNRIGASARGAVLSVSDRDNLILGDITLRSSSAEFESAAEGGVIYQRGGTRMNLTDGSTATLTANRLELGGSGNAEITLGNDSHIYGRFSDGLQLGGRVQWFSDRSSAVFTGNAASNTVRVAATANGVGSFRRNVVFDLGAGDDRIRLESGGYYELLTGAGADVLDVATDGANVQWLDFDADEDQRIDRAL